MTHTENMEKYAHMNSHFPASLFYAFHIILLNTSIVYAATFTPLGDISGGETASIALAVSDDGGVVVGHGLTANGHEAFRWDPETGMVNLGLPSGVDYNYPYPSSNGIVHYSQATGVSADGNVIVGCSHSINSGTYEAFRWISSTGVVSLGDINGLGLSSCRLASWENSVNVSTDGMTIVGKSDLGTGGTEAFRWTESSGFQGIGDLPGGGINSFAHAVSGHGGAIVGLATTDMGTEAFRWTTSDGMSGLGYLPGSVYKSTAHALSADGSIVVGSIYFNECLGATPCSEAFRWTAAEGMVALDNLLVFDVYHDSTAWDVSNDGNVIVGTKLFIGAPNGWVAFYWTPQNGMRTLRDVLQQDHGLDLSGWWLLEAKSVSGDGNIIVGRGINPVGFEEGWIVNLSPSALPIQPTYVNLVLKSNTISYSTNVDDGTILNYTVTNKASHISNTAAITVTLPASINALNAMTPNGQCQINASVIECHFNELTAYGGNVTVNITVVPKVAGTHNVIASVNEPGNEIAPDDNVLTTVFHVNSNPNLTLVSPQGATTILPGETINFDANANDLEDGNLDNAIVWSSDIDGVLGSGGSLTYSGLSSGLHTIRAHVSDSTGATASQTVAVTVNIPPVANADFDQTRPEGSIVTLNGSATDNDGMITNYNWSQIGGPSVFLSGAETATASFTAPLIDVETSLTFELTATDNNGAMSSDTVTITVANVIIAPIANAGLDQIVSRRSTVTLDGSGSYDANGSIVSYQWLQISGDSVSLSNANRSVATFTAPRRARVADLVFSLTITDNDGGLGIDQIVIAVTK